MKKRHILVLLIQVFAFTSAWYLVSTQFQMIHPLVPLFMNMLISFPALILFVNGNRQRAGVLIFLGLFAFLIEYLGITTGFPYSSFEYTERIGYLLFDTVPLMLPFAWLPLIIGTSALGKLLTESGWKQLLVSVMLLLLTDLVLDPGAVKAQLWHYAGTDSMWHNVPIENFLGWILSGGIGSYVVLRTFPKRKFSIYMVLSWVIIVSMWMYINLLYGLLIPAFIGILLILFVYNRTYVL